MTNTDIMNLNLTRHETLQVTMALNNLVFDMQHELDNKDITEERKKILIESIEMWRELKSKIKTQFSEQDAE